MLEQLRGSQEAQKNCEVARHRLEGELREMAMRLEQSEQVAIREGKRIIAKLQNRVTRLRVCAIRSTAFDFWLFFFLFILAHAVD